MSNGFTLCMTDVRGRLKDGVNRKDYLKMRSKGEKIKLREIVLCMAGILLLGGEKHR